MNTKMCESNLSDIPSEVIRKALCDVIEEKVKSKKHKISVSSASKAGESNFVGIVHRVLFSKEIENKNERSEEFKLILKVAPENETRRTHFHSRDLFLQEIYVYSKVFPFFRQFEQSKGVNERDGFNEYPKCCRYVTEELSECLLLEDLCDRDFNIIDRYTNDVTADHVYLVMKSLAKLHAISFALKDQQPENFKALASNLDERFIRLNDPFVREFFNNQTKAILNVLSDEKDAHLLAKVKKLLEKDAIDIAFECLSTEIGAVITHGDIWQNNTMFRCGSNGKPVEISLLDWQVSRHSSPILDITYFMFCCTTKELRDGHYDNFLKVYHENLSNHIRRLGSDPGKLFPYTLMLEHFHKFAKYGLILSSALLPMITTERGNGLDLNQMADIMENPEFTDIFNDFISENSRKKFNKRMRDVVVDIVRLGYI